MLEFGEAALDQISQGVEVSIDDGLDLSIALGRDDAGDAPGVEIGEDDVGVVALVAKQHLGSGAGLGHERAVSLHVGHFAAGQDHRDREAKAIAPQVDLGREATSRAAKTFVLSARFF